MARRVSALLVLVTQLVLLYISVTSAADCSHLDLAKQVSNAVEPLTKKGSGETQLLGHHVISDRSEMQVYVSARHIQMNMEFFSAPFVSKTTDADEFYKLKPGAFCGTSALLPRPSGHFGQLSDQVLKSYVHVKELTCTAVVRHPVLIVERFEYANLYHTMTDFVNTYLAFQQNRLSPADVQVILFDQHDEGALDSVWQDVYSPHRPVIRPDLFRNASGGVCFDHAVFVLPGYNSPIYSSSWEHSSPCRSASLPLAFSQFFYEQYHLEQRPPRDDSSALAVTLVLRNDYIAHPRNPSGLVVRKWANNTEIIEGVQKACSQFNCLVSAVDFAVMDFPSQMQLLAKTDILIGVHGAGLSHAMFLPRESYLIEVGSRYHIFQDFARWTGSQGALLFAKIGVTVNPPKQLYRVIAEAVQRILRKEKLTELTTSIEQHLDSFQNSRPRKRARFSV